MQDLHHKVNPSGELAALVSKKPLAGKYLLQLAHRLRPFFPRGASDGMFSDNTVEYKKIMLRLPSIFICCNT